MTASFATLYALLFGLGYLVARVMLIWGWARWVSKRPRVWGVCGVLSFIGISFASASALLAIWTVLFGMGGGFEATGPSHTPNYAFFYRCVSLGALFSALGIVFAVGGVWRSIL